MRRQLGGRASRHRLRIQRGRVFEKRRRQRRADKQRQTIDFLGNQTLVLDQIALGRFQAGAGLGQIQLGGNPFLGALLDQLEGFLLNAQGVLGDSQQFMIGKPGEIGPGHFGHQTDLGASIGFLLGQILLQGLILEVAHPAVQVELIRGDAHRGRINLAGGIAAAAHRALFDAAAFSVDGRKQRGTLNPVLSLIGLDIEGRHPQIAVVGQGVGDELLQAGIGKKIAPAKLSADGGRILDRRRTVLPILGSRQFLCHRQFRLQVFRGQRTAAQQHEQQAGGA